MNVLLNKRLVNRTLTNNNIQHVPVSCHMTLSGIVDFVSNLWTESMKYTNFYN